MIGKMIPFAISFGGKYNTEDQHHMNEEVDMLKDFRFICCTLKEGSRKQKDNQPVILPVSTKMEKRIILEKRGRTDDQITELILDNCRSTYIDGLTDNFTALETLSLINVGLVSLKNFPKLINLKKLELSDNRISNSLSHLTGSPKLTHLNLSGNRIKDFDELKPLQNLGNLEVLDLFNNQVTLVENYRDKIFQLLPSLKYLDGFDKDFAEAPSDEEEIVEEEDTCEESDDVSLAYLYNDDLEEDQEDWKSVEGEDDDSDSDDEDGIENCEAEETSSDGPGEKDEDSEGNDDDSEEVPADGADLGTGENPLPADTLDSRTKAVVSDVRGKKRKLDGTDSDG